eukprot:794142_1
MGNANVFESEHDKNARYEQYCTTIDALFLLGYDKDHTTPTMDNIVNSLPEVMQYLNTIGKGGPGCMIVDFNVYWCKILIIKRPDEIHRFIEAFLPNKTHPNEEDTLLQSDEEKDCGDQED